MINSFMYSETTFELKVVFKNCVVIFLIKIFILSINKLTAIVIYVKIYVSSVLEDWSDFK